MALDTATLFAQNRDNVMTPILPADQVGRGISLSQAFSGAASTSPLKTEAIALPATAANINAEPLLDRQSLANAANIAGQSLRSAEGMQAPQGDAAYMGGQAAKLAMEAGGATLKLGGEAIVGLLGAITGRTDPSDDMEEVRFRPTPTFSQGMPSPGGGMGG